MRLGLLASENLTSNNKEKGFMQIFRTLRLVFLSVILAISAIGIAAIETPAQQQVENVDIQGNRRLRDDDLLYYIKTRPGDVYSPTQLERDLRELLSLNFFDKTATRVLTEEGPRGGVNVIFEVKELPIIRDLQFQGAKALQESDILKEFREKRVGISKEAVYNPVNVQKANRVIRELLASKGYPNAKIEVKEEEVSATSIAITFNVDQGNRSRIIEIDFEGNEVFKDSELRGAMELVKKSGLISRFKGQDILDLRKLEYDLQKNVGEYMRSKGYFRAQIGEPKIEGLGYKRTGFFLPLPLLTSKDDTLKIIVPITEGKVYRVGELKVEGNSIFSEQQILGYVGLQKGEIADGKRLRNALYEDLKKIYGAQGFVLYDAELEPDYKDNPANPKEGIIDVKITIDEGKQFRLRRLEFTGNTFTRDRVLRREVLVNEGDIYNQIRLEQSILRLNQTQYFDPIDKDKDVEIRTDEENGDVDLVLKVKEKGRQQIQFNGGVSGIGGSFFGLQYSTNNLLGRGETLALDFGFGNRQKNFQFSFQEPYFRDRPITVGFSLFGATYKFFGEGTFLSQNEDAILGGLTGAGTLLTNEENLFTQTTYGASIFATAPLSEILFKKRQWTQFSRIGLTYQFSASTIKDPPVNASNDPTKTIPIVFAQPNITTSRVTGSFVYDTRQPSANGIDMLTGKQLAVSLAFSGLGGDVRTYQPSVVYSQFIPVRRKRSANAEVFGFRIQAGTIGSFSVTDKIRNANSLSFISGIPFYERYFLGSENDIRGYETRSIGPIAAIDGFLTTQDVVLATNVIGTPTAFTGTIDPAVKASLISLGTFTGSGGANPMFTSRNNRVIGGDTQFLGNFEYRVPIFGPIVLAAFADVGTVFNRNKGGVQAINSNFLPDQPFLGSSSIGNVLLLKNLLNPDGTENTSFFQQTLSGGFLLDKNGTITGAPGNPLINNPVTKAQFNAFATATCILDTNNDGKFEECPTDFLTANFNEVFLRGNAQTNTLIKINESQFAGFKNFASSVGLELRVQVPVVNVPFRLIYYINPNVRSIDFNGVSFPLAKKNGFRFTVGRTF
jgi:outer membrane protein insertion porin family